MDAISDPAGALDKHLVALQRVELVLEWARTPELQYIFKHDLARDAAYGSILHRRRREFHRSVGEAIERLFPDNLEENAHRLAHHFAESGDYDRALRFYTIAGESAAAIFANAEAAVHFSHAIDAADRAGLGGEDLARLKVKKEQLLELSSR